MALWKWVFSDAVAIVQVTRLFELIWADVDAGDAAGGADDLGKHAGRDADAATEIGDAHSSPETGLQQDSPAGGGVDIVQGVEAASGDLQRA